MSKERAFLQKILTAYRKDESCMSWGVANKIEELLAQPEQEPVAWMYERESGDFTERTLSVGFEKNFDGITIPLYTSPPKREPLSDKHIAKQAVWAANSKHSFKEGVRWAEIQHGIGERNE